jgi:hypothetical protein
MTATCRPQLHIDVARALQSVFTSTADLAARATRFRQRQSKLTGSVFVQALTFGWLNKPEATLEDLAQTAASLGVTISPQGLDNRFGPRAAALLERVLHEAVMQVISAEPAAVPLLQRFAGGVCLLDTTNLPLHPAFARVWPGTGYRKPKKRKGRIAEYERIAGMKAQVRFDLLHGTLSGPFLFPARADDHKGVLHQAPMAAGALLLADLGFFSLKRFRELNEQKVFWLSRVRAGTGLVDATGRQWTLAEFLNQQNADTVDVSLSLGKHDPLPCRFVAMRVPPNVAALRRKRLRKPKKRRHQAHVDQEALVNWNVYATNVPPEMMSMHEAWLLARCRWQIELLFKLWKSEGHIDESRSQKPWRILCETYAKLLGMVVQHWLLLVGCWSHADRSLMKASHTVRRYALPLVVALPDSHLVYGIMSLVAMCLKNGCRVNRRRRAPPTHQLLSRLPKAG